MRGAGKYRHPIVVQSYTETKNDDGEYIKTWAKYLDTRCAYMPGPGREYHQSNQTASSAVSRFIFRHHDKSKAITESMRLVFNGVNWDIDSAIPDPDRREVVITATQKR